MRRSISVFIYDHVRACVIHSEPVCTYVYVCMDGCIPFMYACVHTRANVCVCVFMMSCAYIAVAQCCVGEPRGIYSQPVADISLHRGSRWLSEA